jgi:hypothetical protein
MMKTRDLLDCARTHAMWRPRWDSTRALMFAVVLIAFNLAGLRTTLNCYPLPRKPPPIIFAESRGISIHFSGYRNDGRFEEWFADPATGATSLHKVWPSPHPTLLRIWSPAVSTLALSLLAVALVVALASGRIPRPRMTPRRLAIAMPAAIMATWLILPLAETVANPRGDYHTHSDNRTVHREPFWPRYARRLMGRPWPDDYICPDYPARAVGP